MPLLSARRTACLQRNQVRLAGALSTGDPRLLVGSVCMLNLPLLFALAVVIRLLSLSTVRDELSWDYNPRHCDDVMFPPDLTWKIKRIANGEIVAVDPNDVVVRDDDDDDDDETAVDEIIVESGFPKWWTTNEGSNTIINNNNNNNALTALLLMQNLAGTVSQARRTDDFYRGGGGGRRRRRLMHARPRVLVLLVTGTGELAYTKLFDESDRATVRLCVVYWGKNPLHAARHRNQTSACFYHFPRGGFKWGLLRRVFKRELARSRATGEEFDYVWLPDDDLVWSSRVAAAGAVGENSSGEERERVVTPWQRFLGITRTMRFKLAQPALDPSNGIRVFHPVLGLHERCLLHTTNYIEIMAPLIRFDLYRDEIFPRLLDFDFTAMGHRVDDLWSRWYGRSCTALGVIDATPLSHLKPAGKYTALVHRVIVKERSALDEMYFHSQGKRFVPFENVYRCMVR